MTIVDPAKRAIEGTSVSVSPHSVTDSKTGTAANPDFPARALSDYNTALNQKLLLF